MNSHVDLYKRLIWENLGMREIIGTAEDKWKTAKFLWRIKTEMMDENSKYNFSKEVSTDSLSV